VDQSPDHHSSAAERLLSFTDAVVAIAATLLVLPLVEIVPRQSIPDVGGFLRDNQAAFLTFVLSFLVIYRFWYVHHRIFGDAKDISGPLLWLNALWLLSIVFLPFPTQLVGTQDTDDRVSWGLYIGTMFVASTCTAVGQWLLHRSGRGRWTTASRIRLPLLTATMALAFVLAITIRGAGPWALLLLLPAGFAQRVAGRRRSPRG
jgi:uncharacterized membrane protein